LEGREVQKKEPFSTFILPGRNGGQGKKGSKQQLFERKLQYSLGNKLRKGGERKERTCGPGKSERSKGSEMPRGRSGYAVDKSNRAKGQHGEDDTRKGSRKGEKLC